MRIRLHECRDEVLLAKGFEEVGQKSRIQDLEKKFRYDCLSIYSNFDEVPVVLLDV
jgi:hypothetical protein